MARVLTPRTEEMLDMIPPQFRGSPNIQGAFLAMANELDRIDKGIADLINNFFPQLATSYISIWEAQLGIGIAPSGLTIPQRQVRVLAAILSARNDASGGSWVENITALIGPGWTFKRWTPPSGTTPPVNHIEIKFPFSGTSGQYEDLLHLMEKETPANTELIINTGSGFIVQSSQIQVNPI